MSLLRKLISPSHTIRRHVGRCNFNWYDEGIQYYGFKYYPRHADFEDPPYEPSKLFRIERIKPLKGAPYWEKHILKELKLDGRNNCFAIIKNIPEINQRLWKVKHLVKITPITFPDGFPEKDDVTYLKENGELKVIKKVVALGERIKLTEEFQTDVKKLDGDTLRRHSRKKWLSGWD